MKSHTLLAVLRLFAVLSLLLAYTPLANAAAPARIWAAGRGLPWVNLTDGKPLEAAYGGAATLVNALAQGEAAPRSLAAGDLNGDTAPDLLAGYALGAGGLLAVHPGSPDRQAAALFQPEAALYALPEAADFLAAGDFDGDGREDAVAAGRGGQVLYFLPGDGAGLLGAPQPLSLPGSLTALAVGEIGRGDGLADLALGVNTPAGPLLLVLTGGEWDAAPAAFTLPGEAAALAIGQLDEVSPYDVAIAAGKNLVLLRYDQTLGTVSPAAPQVHPLGFAPLSLALGDFLGGDSQADEIALLAADGQIHLFDRSGQPSSVPALRSPGGHTLLRAKASSLPSDDLLVIGAGQAELLTADGLEAGVQAGSLAVLDGISIAAALPVRLNRDALTDLVFLPAGSATPLAALTEPVRTFYVNMTFDLPDDDLGDGHCSAATSLGTWCTLRAAIQEANASAGHDEIRLYFQVQPGYNGPLPDITEPLNLVGPYEEGNYGIISGAQAGDYTDGLTITSGYVYMEKIAIHSFDSDGVYVHTNGWNVFDHCQFGANNQDSGLRLNSAHNQVRFSVIAGNPDVGVQLSGDDNSLLGNLIGVWRNGAAGPGNGRGVVVGYAENNLIGTQIAQNRNIIANNTFIGISLASGAEDTLVQGNWIGLDESGAKKANGYGVRVFSTLFNTIGGSSPAYGNVISGNNNDGLRVQGSSDGLLIRHNIIGLNAAGTTALGNQTNGIWAFASTGVLQIHENLIGGNQANGIYLKPYDPMNLPCTAHTLNGNTIGTDAARTLDLGNQQNGIRISGVRCVSLGGNYPWYNRQTGILLEADGSNTQALIQNNHLAHNVGNGLEVQSDFNTLSGNYARYNGFNGVLISGNSNTITNNGAHGNLFGVVLSGDGNAQTCTERQSGRVEFNQVTGLLISGSQNAVMGCVFNGNNGPGVEIDGDHNELGAAGTPNEITGNAPGVLISANASNNTLQGNYIGVDANDGAAGNLTANVVIYGASNIIGGSQASQGNVISGGEDDGVLLSGSAAANNSLRNNKIGVNLSGVSGLGNVAGVRLTNGAHDNTLQENQIAYNRVGIQVESGADNTLAANRIYDNSRLGIDLNPEGVTLNDTGDGDTGPNGLQNFPVLTLAQVTANTRLQGLLDSQPNKTYTLHFYGSIVCDSSGYGEGQTYLGQASITTNSAGQGAFDVTVSGAAPVGGYAIATATDANGNTSEFGRCLPVVIGSATFYVNTFSDAADNNIGNGVCDSSAAAGEQCTLRAAIQETNAAVGDDTIVLPAGTYPITLSGLDNTAALGDLDITQNLTIVGSGAYVTTVRSEVADRVFDVRGSSLVTLVGISVAGGHPGTSSDGGGILVSSNARLTLDAVNVQGNQAPGEGGGIYSSGTITLTNSAVVSNTAGSDGGGLYQLTGAATLVNSTVSTNQSNASGGGIYGLGGTLTLRNVTVAFNTADSDGGGSDTQGGGGLYNLAAAFTLGNSVIAENADGSHGSYEYGMADCDGDFASLGYNLVGDRADPYGAGGAACTLTGGTGNTLGGGWFGSTYLTYAAGLGPLQRNGGSTFSHSPVAAAAGMSVDWGSPETPGSSPSACEPYDQRGQPRPVDGGSDGIARCDRGAVEHLPSFISISDAAAAEGSQAVFAVSLSKAAQITFTVEYAASDLSAVGGQDYLAASGVITFPIGSSQQSVAVTTLNDTLNEAAETFQVTLSNARYAFIGDGQALGSISDGDPMPSIFAGDAAGVEGDLGAGGQATFNVTLNGPSGQTVSVDYTVSGDSAAADEDFVALQGQLIFAPGKTAKTVTVNLLGDNLQEGNETFQLTLSSAVNAGIGDASGTGTISDDDIAAVSLTGASRIEGDSGTGTMHFQVTLSNPSTQQVTVRFTTSPGSAQAGSDYVDKNVIIIFAPGTTSTSVGVTINGDEAPEVSETFQVTLANPTGGAVLGISEAIGVIEDDDGYRIYLPLTRK